MTFLGHCSAPAPGQGSGPYLSFSFCPGKISRSCMCPFYFPLSPFSVSNTASINLICWSAKVSLILPSETRLANTRRRYVISRSTHLICASRGISAWGNRSVGMSSVTVFVDPVLTSSLTATEHPLAPRVRTWFRLRRLVVHRLTVVWFLAASSASLWIAWCFAAYVHELTTAFAHGSVQHHLCNFTHQSFPLV